MKMIRCTGCDRPILDRFLLNVLDRPWHTKCVRCCDCKCSLAEKCFSRDGELYCKKDFFGCGHYACRRFGTRCGGCAQGICPNDLVRRTRNRIFHLDCFTCMMCNKRLSTGDELYVIDKNTFVCKEDYLSSSKAKDTNIAPVPAFSDASISPDSQDAQDTKDSEIGHLSDKEENEIDDQDISGKRRGPRTTIKAKQLETLKAAFAASSKPTRHTREQLAQETGLNMRVIQVWFQNRRSKERRVKHLNALDAGRHPFSRSPTLRLVDRLEPGELIQSSHFSHYGDYLSEYYSPGSNCDYFPQGPPPPQGPTPTDQTLSPGPSGTSYGGINPEDSTPRVPGTLLCAPPSETFSSTAPFTLLSLDGNGYSSNLSHPASELSKEAVW